MKMKRERKNQRVNKIKISVIPILLILLLAPALSMSQQYIETPLLDIEIASEDMFIDDGDNILIIGSSDDPTAKSIYLLPSGNYTTPNVLLINLGYTWSISKSGNYVYFSTDLGYYASEIKRFDITNPDGTLALFLGLGKNVMSMSFGPQYLYYADFFGGTVGRIDIQTQADETLISGLSYPIAVRYDGVSNKLYFLEGGTEGNQYKDGTLKVKVEPAGVVNTLLENLEYPKGLWIYGDKVYLTETAGRNTSYGGKISLDRYDIPTGVKTVLVDNPVNSDAVVVASDGKIYLTSWQGSIPGESGKVSVVLGAPPTWLIDRTKWADLEFVRRINGGALQSALRQFGENATNNLTFADPASVNSIAATVHIDGFMNNGAFPRARIGGFFYRDTNTLGVPGDIFAEVGIGEFISGGLKGYYLITRCFNDDCTLNEGVAFNTLQSVDLLSNYALSIDYDIVNHRFIFSIEDTPTYVDLTRPRVSIPDNQWKGISTRISNTGNDPTKGGYVDAKFDNVLVKFDETSSEWEDYDAFESGMIDRTSPQKWQDQTLEFVREQINAGVYRSAVRTYGSNQTNNLNFINANAVKEFQADLTVKELVNISALPARPQARLFGAFYNDGTGTGNAGDRTGDIYATSGIIRRSGNQPSGFYNIVRCTSPNCNLDTEFTSLYYYEDPTTIGPDLIGKPHTLSITWHEQSNKFIFGFDGRLTTPNVTLPAKIAVPNVPEKGVGTRVSGIPLSGSPSQGGHVFAEFANVRTVVDSDEDGVPDSLDNCPTVNNPNQLDTDSDGYGEACDLCPEVANSDANGDGLADACPSTVGQGVASTSGPIVTITFTYNDINPTHLVPPNCDNIVFITNPPIRTNCRRMEPYVLTVLEDGSTLGFGYPGGDWVPVIKGNSWTFSCNLLDIFPEADLTAAGNIEITPMYKLFWQDPGYDPVSNTCAENEVCVDPINPLFQGTMIADKFTRSYLRVEIDIKPGSYSNPINLGSQGNIPVAIFSKTGFDATTVNPYTVKMGDAKVRVVGKKGTLQALNSDVNGDGLIDKVVHIDTQGLALAEGAIKVCLTGDTYSGISFSGCDSVTIVP